ncbi:hypothetical protein BDV06DRAFT_182466 [Aspergillus oleicola]
MSHPRLSDTLSGESGPTAQRPSSSECPSPGFNCQPFTTRKRPSLVHGPFQRLTLKPGICLRACHWLRVWSRNHRYLSTAPVCFCSGFAAKKESSLLAGKTLTTQRSV